jgi:hypothetical protein
MLGGRDAGPGIADHECRAPGAIGLNRDVDPTAVAAVTHRVVDQVAQQRAQGVGVAAHGERLRGA